MLCLLAALAIVSIGTVLAIFTIFAIFAIFAVLSVMAVSACLAVVYLVKDRSEDRTVTLGKLILYFLYKTITDGACLNNDHRSVHRNLL